MAFKLIFLLVALLAVQGLVSGGPLKRNKDVVAAATESDGEGGLEMYGARNESERHARSAGVSDDMLSLIMAQAYIESSENDDQAYAQSGSKSFYNNMRLYEYILPIIISLAMIEPCRKNKGYQLTDKVLRNIINTGGKVFDQPHVSTTYLTMNFRTDYPDVGETVFSSNKKCHAEEMFMNDYLIKYADKTHSNFPDEIWLSQSPCWRKCAVALMELYNNRGVKPPKLYINHLYVGDSKYLDNALDCMAKMVQEGWEILAWDWDYFKLRVSTDKCISDIDTALKSNYFKQRMVVLEEHIEDIEDRATNKDYHPQCKRYDKTVKDCHAY